MQQERLEALIVPLKGLLPEAIPPGKHLQPLVSLGQVLCRASAWHGCSHVACAARLLSEPALHTDPQSAIHDGSITWQPQMQSLTPLHELGRACLMQGCHLLLLQPQALLRPA